MLVLGICAGAYSLSQVVLEKKGERLEYRRQASKAHGGRIQADLLAILEGWGNEVDRVVLTGRNLQPPEGLTAIPEAVAVESAFKQLSPVYPGVQVVVSAGSETFAAYRLDANGLITEVFTGNRCASGTGEFFLQQIARLGLSVEAAIALADGKLPLPLATRCSVFCKSDCTHALNKGADKGQVVSGLCLMIAQKIQELLQQCQAKNCMLAGGVSRITPVAEFLRQSGINVEVPPQAAFFEALGAAHWALQDSQESRTWTRLVSSGQAGRSFPRLNPLLPAINLISFKESLAAGKAGPGERAVVGLDVGSTTTKAVLVRREDLSILGRVYLRTEGNPLAAARRCYEALAEQNAPGCTVTSLGVTGSGRQIAGLHALTGIIVNEIIAHASAAAHFDPTVDTIIELGGQDAKYTLLQNGVPVEYAMNEACSAGTGSFLEEAARESLALNPEEIQGAAFQASSAPNFNDQCAAFIGSDIKTALQEGLSREEIAAGLVYSICQNYLNRVKGARPLGKRIFMQGGVCYNQAVPAAMAALLEREIVVPPEPGLMGAFGVALEAIKRLDSGLAEPTDINLQELARREITQERTFTCKGGKERCDLNCSISMLRVAGALYPFGGACSKYTGLRRKPAGASLENPVRARERIFWRLPEAPTAAGPRVGINRSLLTHTLFPLYSTFFASLGCQVSVPSAPCQTARNRLAANFCYPVELAHTHLAALLEMQPDWIFLPQVAGLPAMLKDSCTCPMAQAEPYYLRAAFPEWPAERLLIPVLNFSGGLAQSKDQFLALGIKLGFSRQKSLAAYQQAMAAQQANWDREKSQGLQLLQELKTDRDDFAIVIFGRPYNALAPEANLAIPQKLTSRGVRVIPHQWLPCLEQPVPEGMYWSLGQEILQAAHFTLRHPRLFGLFITNFSCGPDSFLINYFREIMGNKPSLVLELDHHTADAGLDTRIEAFLDIIQACLNTGKKEGTELNRSFQPALTYWEGKKFLIRDSRKNSFSWTDSRVKLVIPAMGLSGNLFLAAALRHQGLNTLALAPPSPKELQRGKEAASCKECLPLQLTAGSMLSYVEKRRDAKELTVFFMPKTSGPCRFGQYHVLLQQIVRQQEIEDLTFLSLSSANSYAGLPTATVARAWQAIVLADVMEDIHYTLQARALDPNQSQQLYGEALTALLEVLEKGAWKDLQRTLPKVASLLKGIPLRQDQSNPRVLLTGEIYVRKDPLAQHYLASRLAEAGIAVTTSPIGEWLDYCDLLYNLEPLTARKRWKARLEKAFKSFLERRIKNSLASSGLYHYQPYQARHLVKTAAGLISQALRGEAVLTVGGTLAEARDLDGVAMVGPFGCMPHRIAEAVLTPNLRRRQDSFPFLAVESDGNPFPRAVETRLEAFIDHVHQRARKRT